MPRSTTRRCKAARQCTTFCSRLEQPIQDVNTGFYIGNANSDVLFAANDEQFTFWMDVLRD